MIQDGLKFNKCHTVTQLPVRDADGNLMPYVQADKENYVYFGQIVEVADGVGPAPHLIDTGLTRTDGSKVFAKVIPVKGYSLTNMMYAKGAYNGYVYLAKDGKFFRAKVAKVPGAEGAEVVAVAKDETAAEIVAAENAQVVEATDAKVEVTNETEAA